MMLGFYRELIIVGIFTCLFCQRCDERETNLVKFRKQLVAHDDSLLLQAGEFLLRSMSTERLEQILSKQEEKEFVLLNDLRLAVEQYRQQTIENDIPWDVFCEYVLPPQIYNEEYMAWREKCYANYLPLWKAERKVITICDSINRELSDGFVYSADCMNRVPNWLQFLTDKRGNCMNMSQIVLYPLRALCIPAAIDYVVAWGNVDGAHAWNVLYEGGKMIPFMGLEKVIGYDPFLIYDYVLDTSKNAYRYPPKIFRRTLSVNKYYASLFTRFHQRVAGYELFANLCFEDVTSEYLEVSDVFVKVKNQKEDLCTLSVFNAARWIPVSNGLYILMNERNKIQSRCFVCLSDKISFV